MRTWIIISGSVLTIFLFVAVAIDNSNVQMYISEIYFEGNYVKRDWSKGVEWAKKSAKRGNPKAQIALLHLSRNKLIRPLYKELFQWISTSSQYGYNAHIQYEFGKMYLNGEGTKRNNSKAYTWFVVSSLNGHKVPDDDIFQVAEVLTPDELHHYRSVASKINTKIKKSI